MPPDLRFIPTPDIALVVSRDAPSGSVLTPPAGVRVAGVELTCDRATTGAIWIWITGRQPERAVSQVLERINSSPR